MITKKEELIKTINDAPVDEFETVVLIAKGKTPKEDSGTLCCVQGTNEDLLVSTCMAFEKSPELFKFFMDSIKTFGLGMQDKLAGAKKLLDVFSSSKANA